MGEEEIDIPKEAKRGVVVRIPDRKQHFAFAAVDGQEVFIKPQLALKNWLREGQVVYVTLKAHERGLRAQRVYRTDKTVSVEEIAQLRKQLKQS